MAVQSRVALSLALLVCCVLLSASVVSAARWEGEGEGNGKEPAYDPFSPEHGPERPDSYKEDSYGRHEDREHYGGYQEDRHEPYGKEGDHHWSTLCLVKSATSVVDDVFIDEFRCCTPQDDADVCLHNSTDYRYGGYQHPSASSRWEDDSFLDTTLSRPKAATCRSTVSPEACPSFVNPNIGCTRYQTKCFFTSKAGECGCPTSIQALEADVWGLVMPVLSCDARDPIQPQRRTAPKAELQSAQPAAAGKRAGSTPTPTGPYVGTGFRLQGSVKLIQTEDGVLSTKGNLQIVDGFGADLDSSGNRIVATRPFGDTPLIKSGKMLINLLVPDQLLEKYRREEPKYGGEGEEQYRQEEPYGEPKYGREEPKYGGEERYGEPRYGGPEGERYGEPQYGEGPHYRRRR